MKFTLTRPKKEEAPKRFSWNPIHPRRDWQRLLIAFVILSLLIVGWSSYLFFLSGQAGGPALMQLEEVDDTGKQIDYISSYFENRK